MSIQINSTITTAFFTGRFMTINKYIEVFRTNVNHSHEAQLLLEKLREQFYLCEPSFDLEDCDRVLRLADPTGKTSPAQVIGLLKSHGFDAQVMED